MRRPRRRRKVVLSVVVATTAVGVAGWGTWELVDVFTGGGSTARAEGPERTCSARAQTADAKPVKLPKLKDITVNVLNATTRSGLAKKTAEELEKRGFTIGKVDNAPPELDKKVKASGLLMGSKASYENHTLSVLGTQLAGAETRTDDRKGKSVDLILGDGFTKLKPAKGATQALTALASPSPKPKPSC